MTDEEGDGATKSPSKRAYVPDWPADEAWDSMTSAERDAWGLSVAEEIQRQLGIEPDAQDG